MGVIRAVRQPFDKPDLVYQDSGILKIRDKLTTQERLDVIHKRIWRILLECNPAVVAIEQTFCGINSTTTLRLAEARGVILWTCRSFNTITYPVSTVRKVVVGKGNCDKQAVRKAVNVQLSKQKKLIDILDESDALAVAMCHGYLAVSSNKINV